MYGEWISVEEELPPMNEPFDVWDDYNKCRLADHGAFVGSWDDDFRKETMLIKGHTHWMALPEAPGNAQQQVEADSAEKPHGLT